MIKPFTYLRYSIALLPILTIALASPHADAQVYKWIAPNGVKMYTDKPPANGARATTPIKAPVKAPASSSAPVSNNAKSTSSLTTQTKPVTTTQTDPVIVQKGLMPAVDTSKNMLPSTGFSTLLIKSSSLPKDQPTIGTGDFRIECPASHMSNNDPIFFPNQKGNAPHHTFFGNTSIDEKTNGDTVFSTGNSTCMGGIANRSGYWVPSMVDTTSNTPIKPEGALWYYKSGYDVDRTTIKPPPKGLRMVAGNMRAKSASESMHTDFVCFDDANGGKAINLAPDGSSPKYIPACPQGARLVAQVSFPQCWDGKNLDSLDHISHMSYQFAFGNPTTCPATHPYPIPKITLNVHYRVTSPDGTKFWRIASDDYQKNGYNAGYSLHAGWISGWDEQVIGGIVKNCVNKPLNCGTHMLGDGRIIYWP